MIKIFDNKLTWLRSKLSSASQSLFSSCSDILPYFFLFLESLSIAGLLYYFWENYVGFSILKIELEEVYGEFQLLLKILSLRIAGVAVVQVGLTMCGRRRDKCIESRNFDMSLFVWYFSRSPLKSPSKTNVLFSRKSFTKRFAR